MSADSNSPPPATESPSAGPRGSAGAGRPRLALFIATACGLGYIPLAPGTFGSLVGVVLAMVPLWLLRGTAHALGGEIGVATGSVDPILLLQCLLAIVTGALGVWSAARAANLWAAKDPQRVVIDEVSGQHLALVLGSVLPIAKRIPEPVSTASTLAFVPLHNALNWKYLLLGFILFRVFDIWKPFPVRRAESLPGGWGIMADDWVAALYAALGLWLARALGL